VRIDISGRHVAVTRAMEEHAREKIQRLDKYFHGLDRIHVTLSVDGEQRIAEVVAAAARRKALVAHHKAKDMYVAIDAAAEKFERQLKKANEKMHDRRAT